MFQKWIKYFFCSSQAVAVLVFPSLPQNVSKYHFTMAEDGGSGTGDNIIRIMPKVVD